MVSLVAESCPTLVTLWAVAHPAPVHRFSQTRILKWLPFPSSGDLSDPGMEPPTPACRGILYG